MTTYRPLSARSRSPISRSALRSRSLVFRPAPLHFPLRSHALVVCRGLCLVLPFPLSSDENFRNVSRNIDNTIKT
jgi:hypothetical protein